MSGAFALINVLADSIGPGTIGLVTGVERSTFFVTSSLTTLCIILLHVAWGVIFFSGLDNKKYMYNLIVVVVHLAVSSMVIIILYCSYLLIIVKLLIITLIYFYSQTLLNSVSYFATIITEYIILVICGIVAIHVAGGKFTKEILGRSPPRTVSVPVTD